jgi:hypothetical protein
LFAFAGIWDRWNDSSDKPLETCSILTTTPNAITSSVQDRMPVILDPVSFTTGVVIFELKAKQFQKVTGGGSRKYRRSA